MTKSEQIAVYNTAYALYVTDAAGIGAISEHTLVVAHDYANNQRHNAVHNAEGSARNASMMPKMAEALRRSRDAAFRAFNTPSTSDDPCVNGCRCS